MCVYEARGSLENAIKELMIKWTQTKASWDDPMSRSFEEKFLQHLQMDMRNAVSAMDQMAVLLAQIHRDCE